MEPHEIATVPGIHDLFSGINLFIVLGLIVFLSRKAIVETFRGRSQKIRDDLVVAREELKKISQDIENARASLAGIEKEKADLIRNVEEEGKSLAKKLIEEARAGATRIRDDAGSAVGSEFAEMRGKFKAELLQSLFEKVRAEFLNENSRQKLHEKLIEGFLSNAGELSREVKAASAGTSS